MFELRKAERRKAKLRVGVSAPSGAGKTYSALLLARGMASEWEKIALIDTENGSGELYSHLGEYNVITLTAPFSPERYIEAVQACEQAGMEVIVIDSTSHEWDGEGGCLQINEKLAQAKYKGNTWSAWSETTPRHQRFLEAIVMSSCHVITTARNKVETVMTEDKRVKKVGTKEIQREGFEYELTVNFNIDRDTHAATASKDRTELFTDKDPFVITEETGKTLKEWAESGKEDTTQVERAEKRKTIGDLLSGMNKTEEWYFAKLGKPFSSYSNAQLDTIIENIQVSIAKKQAEDAERKRQEKEEGRATLEEEAQMTLEQDKQ